MLSAIGLVEISITPASSDAKAHPSPGAGALEEVGTLLDGVPEGLPVGVLVRELLFSTSVKIFLRRLFGAAWLPLDLGVTDPSDPWEITDSLEPAEDTREGVAKLFLLSTLGD